MILKLRFIVFLVFATSALQTVYAGVGPDALPEAAGGGASNMAVSSGGGGGIAGKDIASAKIGFSLGDAPTVLTHKEWAVLQDVVIKTRKPLMPLLESGSFETVIEEAEGAYAKATREDRGVFCDRESCSIAAVLFLYCASCPEVRPGQRNTCLMKAADCFSRLEQPFIYALLRSEALHALPPQIRKLRGGTLCTDPLRRLAKAHNASRVWSPFEPVLCGLTFPTETSLIKAYLRAQSQPKSRAVGRVVLLEENPREAGLCQEYTATCVHLGNGHVLFSAHLLYGGEPRGPISSITFCYGVGKFKVDCFLPYDPDASRKNRVSFQEDFVLAYSRSLEEGAKTTPALPLRSWENPKDLGSRFTMACNAAASVIDIAEHRVPAMGGMPLQYITEVDVVGEKAGLIVASGQRAFAGPIFGPALPGFGCSGSPLVDSAGAAVGIFARFLKYPEPEKVDVTLEFSPLTPAVLEFLRTDLSGSKSSESTVFLP